MLAKNSRAPCAFRLPASSFTSCASKLSPTQGVVFCRSELAREKRWDAACIQADCVIVDVLREQARSYRGPLFS
ncbi:hypothetical protein PS914_00550 [Pseudomonas fluorescens]|nr:hypothetical protein PS914_00550 [Pseudomonas fluorescens]